MFWQAGQGSRQGYNLLRRAKIRRRLHCTAVNGDVIFPSTRFFSGRKQQLLAASAPANYQCAGRTRPTAGAAKWRQPEEEDRPKNCVYGDDGGPPIGTRLNDGRTTV